MKGTDDTFALVKSLTKSEKRFFRLSSALTEGTKNYLKVFDLMDKMETYDAKKLGTALRPARLNLSHEKIYLRRMLLKTLRNYHSGHFPLAMICELLQDADLLYRKGLHEQALPCLERAKKLAVQYEYFTLQLELLYFERKIYQRHRSKESMDKSREITHEIDEQLALLGNRVDFDRIHATVMDLNHRHGLYQNDDTLAQLEQLCHTGLMREKTNARSISATKAYHSNLVTHYWHKGDFVRMTATLEENVQLQEDHPGIIEKEPHGYLASLYNLALIYLKERDDEKFRVYLGKINAFAEVDYLRLHESLRAGVLERAVNLEVKYFIDTARFEEGKAVIGGIKMRIQPYARLMSKDFTATLHYNFARLCFGSGDHREAIRHLNEVVNNARTEIGQDNVIYAKILLIIIHYELGNKDLLGYLAGLIKNTPLKEKESAIIGFFRDRLSAVNTPKETIAAMKEFRETIAAFPVSDYFDMDVWLRSKIEGKTFGVLAKESGVKEKR